MTNKIVIGSDHAGLSLKNELIDFLKAKEVLVEDVGTYNEASVNFAPLAKLVADKVSADSRNKGILVCGTGIGMSIMANKIPGIRAALVHDLFSAKATRQHNDSNVLCLGARIIAPAMALEITKIWLETFFLGGKYMERLQYIENYDENRCI